MCLSACVSLCLIPTGNVNEYTSTTGNFHPFFLLLTTQVQLEMSALLVSDYTSTTGNDHLLILATDYASTTGNVHPLILATDYASTTGNVRPF